MQHPDEGTIHAWLDQALPPDESARLAAHVAACESCAAAVADARGLIAASSRILADLDDVPAGVIPGTPGTDTDPLAALRKRRVRERAREHAHRRWWRDSRVLAAAGVAFLAVGTATIVRFGGVPAVPMVPAAERAAAPAAPPGADSAMTPSPSRFVPPAPPEVRDAPSAAAKALAKVDSSVRREVAAQDTAPSRAPALADVAQSGRAGQPLTRQRAASQQQGLTPPPALPLGAQQVPRPPVAAQSQGDDRARQTVVTTAAKASNRARALDEAISDAARVLAGCYRLAPPPGGTSVPSFLPAQLVLDTTMVRVPGDSAVWFRAEHEAASPNVAPSASSALVWRPIGDTRTEVLVASVHDGARPPVRLVMQGNDLLAERAQATGRAALARPAETDLAARNAHAVALRLPCRR